MNKYELTLPTKVYLFVEETLIPKENQEVIATPLHMFVGIRDRNDLYVVKARNCGLLTVDEVLLVSIFDCQHTNPLMLSNFRPSVFHTAPGVSLRESKEIKFLKLHELSEELLERLEIAVTEHNQIWNG